MEKIIYNNTVLAILFKGSKNGVIPLTDPNQPLQVVAHKRKKGDYTKAHLHTPKMRVVQSLQECLVVMKGEIQVDLYTPGKKLFKSLPVSSGEVILFLSGGHAVHIVKDSEIIEVKNGPFIDDKVMIE